MAAQIPEPLLEELSCRLDLELGLHFPKPRWPDLGRGIQAASLELGFATAGECAEWLVSERLTKAQLELLAAHLTVGETYFFRDPAVFEFLQNSVLPGLIDARRKAGRQIRIWSAACCTGEEPYSIAMVLRRLLPDIADWRVTILATDVNARFLKKAALGHYGRWSFRGVPDNVREQNFHRVQEGTWEIALPIKKMVSFSPLNLAEDIYPSLVNDTNAMDVIFCRNVLIYFSREHGAKVASKLHQSLLDGGWLFTSAPEVASDVFSRFATVREPGIIALRKLDEPVARPGTQPPASRPAPTSRAPARVAAEVPSVGKTDPRPDLAQARKLANEGRLTEALAECDKAIAEDGLVAGSHYLRGMILQENAAFEPAREALRRALFLDPDLVVAHFALGNLLRRQERGKEAAKCFENARALLQKYAPTAELPESDGITAGRLLSIVESVQDVRV